MLLHVQELLQQHEKHLHDFEGLHVPDRLNICVVDNILLLEEITFIVVEEKADLVLSMQRSLNITTYKEHIRLSLKLFI